jgi:hypothetical protein
MTWVTLSKSTCPSFFPLEGGIFDLVRPLNSRGRKGVLPKQKCRGVHAPLKALFRGKSVTYVMRSCHPRVGCGGLATTVFWIRFSSNFVISKHVWRGQVPAAAAANEHLCHPWFFSASPSCVICSLETKDRFGEAAAPTDAKRRPGLQTSTRRVRRGYGEPRSRERSPIHYPCYRCNPWLNPNARRSCCSDSIRLTLRR